ncbi:MAG: hypothetical protein EA402_09655 [Planctomycetota bacterium]|nr:MAG: hypothetical protein EA402_09655 [Planctomycetota bacterium]
MKELEQKLEPLLAVDVNELALDRISDGTSWPARCLTNLRNAHEQGDAAAIGHWQAEYQAALEWARDLIAWGHLLAQNQLSNLDFQQANSELFQAMVPAYKNLRGGYNPNSHVGRFPAGTNGLYGIWNWLEVERQADLLLAPDAQWEELARQPFAHPSVLAVPPPYRASAAQIRQALPPNAQATWEEALSAPYERSFVIAALARYQKVQALEQVADVMTLAAQQWPRQEIPLWALMDALPWRAGDSFAGMEWADRFSPAVSKLMPQRLPNQKPQRFAALHQLVYNRYQQCEYSGLVLTLREALQRNSMDCIRVTDLYGALWRNMGQAGFLPIRQIRAGMGHTIAGLILHPGDRGEVIISMDGMIAENRPRRWPDTAGGGQSGELVCNELFYRGLDGYVFLEGVIVRGSQAGTRIQAAVPWLPGRQEATRSNLDR